MGAFQPHGGPVSRAAVGLFSPAERADLYEIEQVNAWEGLVLDSEFQNPDEHQIRLASELNDVRMFISDDDQMFSGLWLNRSRPDDDQPRPLLLVGNGFLASVADTDGRYRAYHLARQFPEHQVIVYDQPGHGLSSPFTDSQRKEMSQGGMEGVGGQQFSAINDFVHANLAPVANVIAKAESFGARGMLDVATASLGTDLEVSNMVLLELPGTEDGRRVAVHAAYFGYEFIRSSYYNAGIEWWPSHKQEFDEFVKKYSGSDLPPKPDSFFKNDSKMARANFYNSVLGHGNGLAVMRRLIQSDITIVRSTAEKGQIDRLAAAEMQRREMLWSEGKTWGQIVMLHESHDGTGFAPRARIAAALTSFATQNATDLSLLGSSYPTTMRRVQTKSMLMPKEMTF